MRTAILLILLCGCVTKRPENEMLRRVQFPPLPPLTDAQKMRMKKNQALLDMFDFYNEMPLSTNTYVPPPRTYRFHMSIVGD